MVRDLNDLYLFTLVARSASFSGAARSVGLPVSSVSRKIRRLEERLEHRLFVRTTRRVELTEVGRILLERLEPAFELLDGAEHGLAADSLEGTVRVSMPHHLEPALFAFFTDFCARYEGVDVEVVFSNRKVSLHDEGIDVAIRAGQPSGDGLIVRKLFTLPMALVASADYIKQRPPIIELSDLSAHDAILMSARSDPAPWLRAPRQLFGVPVRVRMVVNSLGAAIESVRAGLGLSFLPIYLVDEALCSGELVLVLPGYFPHDVPFFSMRIDAPPRSALIKRLIDDLHEHVPMHLAAAGAPIEQGPD